MSSSEFRPVFVVGCQRSGTTLLATLLGRHGQVAMTPETHFFWNLKQLRLPLAPGMQHAEIVSSLPRFKRWEDLRLDSAALLERFKAFPPDYPHLFRAALELYAEREGKPRAGEKTPVHLFNVRAIHRCYPAAKFICIVRDGRDMILSSLKSPWEEANPDPRWMALYWRISAKLCVEYEAQLPGHFLRVHFEHLLQEPVEVLTRINRFVGLEFEPRQLDSSESTGVTPEWEHGWKEKARQTLDPSRAYAWRKSVSGETLWSQNAMMAPYLAQFNYPDPGFAGCPMMTRLRLQCRHWLTRLANERRAIAVQQL